MNGEFKLSESFGIDNGELYGMTPQECFVLGYELANIKNKMNIEDNPFHMTVHASNKDRIEAALIRRNRRHSWAWPDDDVSEDWIYLAVGAA